MERNLKGEEAEVYLRDLLNLLEQGLAHVVWVSDRESNPTRVIVAFESFRYAVDWGSVETRSQSFAVHGFGLLPLMDIYVDQPVATKTAQDIISILKKEINQWQNKELKHKQPRPD
ncbi:MAG: hypothetical protein Q7S03_03115 [bacterium]|nr:hypothetical protein [bacterium]